MDVDRREHLAAAARALLPALRQAVVDSWGDLLPTAGRWSALQHARAVAAADAVLGGIPDVIAQGDLDERSWLRTVETVYARGRATTDEVGELLRSVRVVGVELLLDALERSHDLTSDERWSIQLRAHSFCEQIHRVRDDVAPEGFEELLAGLETEGADYGESGPASRGVD
jgi:hypothetical protein